MVNPVRPADMYERKAKQMPPEVMEAFNELITQNYTGSRSIVRQKEVVDRIVAKMMDNQTSDFPSEPLRRRIFDEHWLDIEGIFQKAGWKVVYDKPGYNEDGEAVFVFTSATKKPWKPCDDEW